MQNKGSFAWGALDAGVFVMIHDRQAPDDADWDECIRELDAYRRAHPAPRAIIFTDGGAPTGPQRRRLDRLVESSPPTAVVSDTVVVRFVVASLALLNSSIATFASSEIDAAWKHVGLDGPAAQRARAELRKTVETLGPQFVTVRRALGLG